MKLIVIFSTFLVKRQWALLEMALYIYSIIIIIIIIIII